MRRIRKPTSQIIEFVGAPDLPQEGKFLVPLCVTVEELELLATASIEHPYKIQRDFQDATFLPLLQAINYVGRLDLVDCLPGVNVGECFKVDTTNEAICFFPNDPYVTQEQERPTVGQWETLQQAEDRPPQWLQDLRDFADENIPLFDGSFGYFPNDCFVVPTQDESVQGALNSLQALLTFTYPYVEFNLKGSGEFEMELLNVPSGGTALIVWDAPTTPKQFFEALFNGDPIDFSNVIVTELSKQLFQIPPDTLVRNSIEIQLDGDSDTEHTVRVYFVPRFSIALDFVGIGGGIRSVTACGDLKLIGCQTGEEINGRNYGLEQHRREGFIMTTAQELCEAVECGIVRVASRIVSGSAGNLVGSVTIDKDSGQIVIKDNGGTTAPIGATTEEIQSGRVSAVFNGLNKYIADFENYYVDFPQNQANTVLFLSAKYQLDEDRVAPAVSEYYSQRGASTPAPSAFNSSLKGDLYCSGITTQTIQIHIVDVVTDEQQLLISMMQPMTQAQLEAWADIGTSQPSSDYLGFPCYRASVQIIEYKNDFARSQPIPFAVAGTRRYLVLFEGELQSNNSDLYFDGLYVHNRGVDPVVSEYKPLLLETTSPVVKPPIDERKAFYNTSGTITEIKDTTGSLWSSWFNNGNTYGWTGNLTLKITDLGNV